MSFPVHTRFIGKIICFVFASLLVCQCAPEEYILPDKTVSVSFYNQLITPAGESVTIRGGYPITTGKLQKIECGFLYSADPLTELDYATANKFATETSPIVSEHTIESLAFQTSYKIRPYLVTEDSIYYGQTSEFTTYPPISGDLTIYGYQEGDIIVEGYLRNFTEYPYERITLLITRISSPGQTEVEITRLTGNGNVKSFSYLGSGVLLRDSRYYVSVLIEINEQLHYVGGKEIETP